MHQKPNNERILKCREGFTVVELVITLAILLIAVSLGLTYISYVARSNDFIEKQSGVQQNVVAAKNIIDRSLRVAKEVRISDDPGAPEGWQVYYIEEEDGRGTIMYRKADLTAEPLLGDLGEGYNMRLSFRKTASSFVEVGITCDVDGEYEYDITVGILILGIEPSRFSGDSGSCIAFK